MSHIKIRGEHIFYILFLMVGLLLMAIVMPAPRADALKSTACLRINNAKGRITTEGTAARAAFTIPKKCGQQRITLVSYQAPNPTNGRPYEQQVMYRYVTQNLNPGRHTMTVALPDCHYQVDLVRGEPLDRFQNGITYHSQRRFLAAEHGGNRSCFERPAVRQQAAPTPPSPVSTPPVVKNAVCTDLDAYQISDEGKVPATVNFHATVNDTDSGRANYIYNFGDGSAPQTSTSETASHTYTKSGTYNASVAIAPNTSTVNSVSSGTNTNNDGNNSQNLTANTTASNGSGTNDTEMNDSRNTACAARITIREDEAPVEQPRPAQPAGTGRQTTELPRTGPGGPIAALGFGSTFMASVVYAYRGRLQELTSAIVSRF